MKYRFLELSVLAVLTLCIGCRTTEPAQGLDRGVASARAAIQQKFPAEHPDNLRLDSIILLDHSSNTGRACMVVFEDTASIQVTTNHGVRTRTARHIDAHVAADGSVASVDEGRSSATGRAKR
jgi:hypothetical protein